MKLYYCPKCRSSSIRRIKRGFIRKIILRMSPLYICYNCKHKFTQNKAGYTIEQELK